MRFLPDSQKHSRVRLLASANHCQCPHPLAGKGGICAQGQCVRACRPQHAITAFDPREEEDDSCLQAINYVLSLVRNGGIRAQDIRISQHGDVEKKEVRLLAQTKAAYRLPEVILDANLVSKM